MHDIKSILNWEHVILPLDHTSQVFKIQFLSNTGIIILFDLTTQLFHLKLIYLIYWFLSSMKWLISLALINRKIEENN